MKCLCILGILASLATAQAATILSTTTKDDPSTLTSGGYGAYYGFSFDLDHMLVSSGSGIAQNSTVYLQSLDIAKATNRADANNGLYVTIFSSATTKNGTTFVGQSTTTIDMAGEGAADGSASWQSASFNNLELNRSDLLRGFHHSTDYGRHRLGWREFCHCPAEDWKGSRRSGHWRCLYERRVYQHPVGRLGTVL